MGSVSSFRCATINGRIDVPFRLVHFDRGNIAQEDTILIGSTSKWVTCVNGENDDFPKIL